MRNWLLGWGVLCCMAAYPLRAQEDSLKQEPPPISMLRAEESYSYLRSAPTDVEPIFLQSLKAIPLSRKTGIYLSLGGEYRARMEHYTNRDYEPGSQTYYSQRLSLNASLTLGSKLRLFGEGYHGLTSDGKQFLESDQIDLHQGFLEWKIVNNDIGNVYLRLGRQEIGYGVSRLIGIREGPNMRRSFDMARLVWQNEQLTMNLVYGKEVAIKFNAFDNTSNLFNGDANNPELWGIYLKGRTYKNVGNVEVYYFGYRINQWQLSDVTGKELRHTVGARSYGQAGRFSYNTELIYQFGDMAGSTISAFNLETDWKYAIARLPWKPTPGIKLDWSSGDGETDDGRLGTFNPLFVNPAIYSLAAVNTPANMVSLHPSLTLYPIQGLSIYLDYAFFYRTRSADGLYTPPNFQVREAMGISVKHIGDVFGLQIQYAVNRNISLDLRSSYFITGQFIDLSGASENIYFLAITSSFKF